MKPQSSFWRLLPGQGPAPQRDPGALSCIRTGKLHLSYGMERWVCDNVTKSLHFQLDRGASGALGGNPEHPEQGEAGEGVVGSRGSPHSSYMVVEARLVSSCLSLPSRARPRFWRLAESRGVTEYVLVNVELAATVSLERWERRGQSQPQPRGAQHHCRHLCRASPALPMQLLGHFLLSFHPLLPLYNHFFFLSPLFLPPSSFSGGA